MKVIQSSRGTKDKVDFDEKFGIVEVKFSE